MEESSDRVEYQLNAIRKKYDIREDQQKVEYIHASAELLCTLGSAVRREVYGHRVAEAAGVSYEAVRLEVEKAFKRRIARQKKQQEKIDLAPARKLQPKVRSIRYDNMKSAMAEEAVLAMVLREPALMEQAKTLEPGEFSCALLGNAFAQLKARYQQGLEVHLAGLTELTGEEMSHLAGVCQRQEGPVSEEALADCVRTIRAEHQRTRVSSDDDLLAFRDKLKDKKGMK